MNKISAVFLLILSLAALMAVAVSADTPVEISSAAELMSMEMDGSYKLVADIDMAGVEFTPIGTDTAPFTGEFDGNSKKIYGLTFETQGKYIGLFGVCKDATIKNVIVDDLLVNISEYTLSQMYISGICAYASGNCSFENIKVNGSISVKGNGNANEKVDIYAAGICAFAKSAESQITFTSCVNKASITAESTGVKPTVRSAGIAASGVGACITLCANEGSIAVKAKSAAYAAGISTQFGQNSLTRTYNTADITAKSEFNDAFAGGLVSICSVLSHLEDCYNAGNVYAASGDKSKAKAGGICTQSLIMKNEYYQCYNAGDVTVIEGGYAGSLVADSNAALEKFVSNYVIESDTPIISKNPKEDAATSLTQTQMKSADSFAGFDFDEVWYMADYGDYRYPMLCGFEIEVPVVLGDLNKDGSTDTIDLIIASRFLANFVGYEDYVSVENFDLDSNGEVNAVDLVILARHLAAWTGYDIIPIEG